MTIRRSSIPKVLLGALILSACAPAQVLTADSSTTTVPPSSTTALPSPATAPPTSPPEPPMSVVVIGDWGAGSGASAAIGSAILQENLSLPFDAIITTGDNFYSDDVEQMFTPFAWSVRDGVSWWVSWGNHDIETEARVDGLNMTFGEPPRWTTIAWGPIDVIILDSNQVKDSAQLAFLHAALTPDRPAVVVFHHPAFSCSKHGSTESVVKLWVPLLEADGDVLLVLNGHDHNYQHFSQNGIEYLVTGGGGRRLYDLDRCPKNHPEVIAGFERHHYLRLTLATGILEVSARADDGLEFDSFQIDLP